MARDPLGRVCEGQAGGGRGGGDPPRNVARVCVSPVWVSPGFLLPAGMGSVPPPPCSPLGVALSAAVLGLEDRVGGRER